jgi:hypothetical protein
MTRALLLALLLAAAAGAQTLSIQAPGIPSTPLALPPAAPGLAPPPLKLPRPALVRTPSLPRIGPAAWNPARAKALDGPAGSAKEILAAANAVLRDFSPEDIPSLAPGALESLREIVLDQLDPGRAGRSSRMEGVKALAARRARLLESLRGAPAEPYRPYRSAYDGQEVPVYTREVPRSLKLVSGPRPVFRHYTSRKGLEGILRSSSLRNGILPYVRLVSGCTRTYYEMLTGAFLTLPDRGGGSVGVPEDNACWVDLRVPDGIPVFEVEPGRIYLIPLPGRTDGWIRDLYFRWIGGEPRALDYFSSLPRLEESGGPGPELFVPVEIAGSSEG